MATPFDNLTDLDKLLLLATNDRLTASAAPEFVYERPSYKEFLGQAEEEVGPYYDKELDILNRTIKTVQKQADETKKLQEQQQAKTEQRTYATEDRNFAELLDSAQKGFAGRGTYTSGFRQGAVEDSMEDRELGLQATRQGFEDTSANRNLGYSQFLESSALKEEGDRLTLDRARKKAIIENATALAEQEATSKKVAGAGYNQGWSSFLTSGGVA